jgi:hypothetical protein
MQQNCQGSAISTMQQLKRRHQQNLIRLRTERQEEQNKQKSRRSKIEQTKLNIDYQNINIKLEKMTKWSRFKVERQDTIDKYINQKRCQMIVGILTKQIKALRILKEMMEVVSGAVHVRMIHNKRIFTCVKVAALWRQRYNYFGGSLESTHRGHIKNRLTFALNTVTRTAEQRAKEHVYFMIGVNFRIRVKLAEFYQIIEFIQKKQRSKAQQKDAKIAILRGLWHKVVSNLVEVNAKVKDKKVKELILKMPKIPPAIQEAALRAFLHHASFL